MQYLSPSYQIINIFQNLVNDFLLNSFHYFYFDLRFYLYHQFIIIWFVRAAKSAKNYHSSTFSSTKWWPLALVALQVTLGIITVLCAPLIVFAKFGTFEIIAELHQLVAMFLLMSLVVNLYVVGKRS